MEFVKHEQHRAFNTVLQSAKGTRLLVLRETTVEVYVVANLSVSRILSFGAAPSAASISPNGQYISFVNGLTLTTYTIATKTRVDVQLPDYCDLCSTNDLGETVLTAQRFIDGTAYKVVGSVLSTINIGNLTGRKFIANGSTLRVSDEKRYGTVGSMVTATDLIIGMYHTHTVVADGKVIGPSTTFDFAERIYESFDCGRYVVVRLATKYAAVKKADTTKADIPQSDLATMVVPTRIAIGPTLKAYTGEQLTITQGSGSLTISGPDAFLSKFKFVTINSTKFPVSFVAGSVTITTAILASAVVQLYLNTQESNALTSGFANATQLIISRKIVTVPNYVTRTDNPLMGLQPPLAPTRKIVAITGYDYGDKFSLMTARAVAVTRQKIAVTSYDENQ
jgi:hypothetical protein